MVSDLSAQTAHRHVWRPDAFGSVCFLVVSGSVAFGVSGVAGYISPSTGQLHNAELTNLGTFIGTLCFLAGALLLLPERTEDSRRPPPARRTPGEAAR